MGKVMLITASDKKKLLANHNNPDKLAIKPVVKIFNPYGNQTWLISEMDPETPDILFGLCDLAMGEPEMGSVSFTELNTVQPRPGLYLERDRWFTADKPLVEYAREARNAGRIVA